MRESPKRLIKTNTEEQRNGAPRVRRAARSAVPQRKALARESRADSDATRARALSVACWAGFAGPRVEPDRRLLSVSAPFLRFSVCETVTSVAEEPRNRGQL